MSRRSAAETTEVDVDAGAVVGLDEAAGLGAEEEPGGAIVVVEVEALRAAALVFGADAREGDVGLAYPARVVGRDDIGGVDAAAFGVGQRIFARSAGALDHALGNGVEHGVEVAVEAARVAQAARQDAELLVVGAGA